MEDPKGTAGKPRRAKTAASARAGSPAGVKKAKAGSAPGAKARARTAPATQGVPGKPAAASSLSPAEREDRVRIAAYLRAERRGFAPGYAVEDWLAAEAEVDVVRAPAAETRKAAARKPRKG